MISLIFSELCVVVHRKPVPTLSRLLCFQSLLVAMSWCKFLFSVFLVLKISKSETVQTSQKPLECRKDLGDALADLTENLYANIASTKATGENFVFSPLR